MLTNEVQTYEWTNVTQISHLFINPSFKRVFNAQYSCVKHTNYEWMNFAQFPLLSHKMISLWCIAFCCIINFQIFFWNHNLASRIIHYCFSYIGPSYKQMWQWQQTMTPLSKCHLSWTFRISELYNFIQWRLCQIFNHVSNSIMHAWLMTIGILSMFT